MAGSNTAAMVKHYLISFNIRIIWISIKEIDSHLQPYISMALIVILLFIVEGAVIYEQYFYENPDQLDEHGRANPNKKKKKNLR